MKKRYIFMMILMLAIITTVGGEVMVEQEEGNRVVVVLKDQRVRDARLDSADELRFQRKFDEAIDVYDAVYLSDSAEIESRKEARYYTGLCKTELGKYDEALMLFNDMLSQYADDGDAVAHTQYCIAWIEVQQGAYYSAIERLNRTLSEKNCADDELNAKMQFMIGRIYASFLLDYEKAKIMFEKVRNEYPDTKMAQHPYITNMR